MIWWRTLHSFVLKVDRAGLSFSLVVPLADALELRQGYAVRD